MSGGQRGGQPDLVLSFNFSRVGSFVSFHAMLLGLFTPALQKVVLPPLSSEECFSSECE